MRIYSGFRLNEEGYGDLDPKLFEKSPYRASRVFGDLVNLLPVPALTIWIIVRDWNRLSIFPIAILCLVNLWLVKAWRLTLRSQEKIHSLYMPVPSATTGSDSLLGVSLSVAATMSEATIEYASLTAVFLLIVLAWALHGA